MYVHCGFDIIIKCGGSEIKTNPCITNKKVFIREWAIKWSERLQCQRKKSLFSCLLVGLLKWIYKVGTKQKREGAGDVTKHKGVFNACVISVFIGNGDVSIYKARHSIAGRKTTAERTDLIRSTSKISYC